MNGKWWRNEEQGEWKSAKDTAQRVRAQAYREPDSLEQLIERKHTELRLDPSFKDPKLMACLDAPPGTLFGINREGPETRLVAQSPALVDVWARELAETTAKVAGHLALLDFPDLTAHIERDIAHQKKAMEEAAFLREQSADAYEFRSFYGQMYCDKPGFNMKLTLDDVDPPKPPRTGDFDNSHDKYIYDLPDRTVKIDGRLVQILKARAAKEPRQAILDAFRTIVDEIRAVTPKAPEPKPAQRGAWADGTGAKPFNIERAARALFEIDPRVVAHVRKVGDATPCGRASDWNAAVVNLAAEKLRLQPYYDKAWLYGAANPAHVGGPTPEQVWRRDAERGAHAVALACQQA